MYSLPARHKKTVAIRHNPQKYGIFYVSQSFFKRGFYTTRTAKNRGFPGFTAIFCPKIDKKNMKIDFERYGYINI